MPSQTTTADILAGNARWSVECADALAWLESLPDRSASLRRRLRGVTPTLFDAGEDDSSDRVVTYCPPQALLGFHERPRKVTGITQKKRKGGSG